MAVNVLVVGGGIIGLTAAHHLAAARLSVEVIDQATPGRQASWAGAGILPPGYPAFATTPVDKLRAVTTRMFAAYSERLLADTGIDNGYTRSGGIEFLSPDDSAFVERWRSERLEVHPVDAAGLRAGEPAVVMPPGVTAYRLPDFAQVRNPWHMRALHAGCAMWRAKVAADTPAVGFEFAGDRVDGIKLANGDVRRADYYLVAAGAWAGPLLAQLGVTANVRPVRGQIVLFRPDSLVLRHILLVGSRYLVPRPDGRILAGATDEPDAGYDATTTPAGVAMLTAFARELVPALAAAEVETAWAGIRPGSADGRPSIGFVPGHANVLAAVGHYRAGVQLSLGTAYLIRNLLLNEPPILPVGPFAVGRPVGPVVPTAFRS